MGVIHCPKCQVGLNVPENMGGRAARCPSCKTKFILPTPEKAMEDTVCAWLASELGEEQEEEALAVGGAAEGGAMPPEPALPPGQMSATTSWTGPDRSNSASLTRVGQRKHLVQTEDPFKAKLHRENQALAPAAVAAPAAVREEALAFVAAPASGPAAPLAPGAPGTPGATAVNLPPAVFPTALMPMGPRPYLVVRDISQSGVRLAFESVWLENLEFRCSMPVRGVFNGSTNPSNLWARPLAFVDRSGAAIRSAAEIEIPYEQPLSAGVHTRDVINSMGIIDGLPRPFCYPMPYYVDTPHKQLSLQCSTFMRPDGSITCEVLIPSGRYALDWLRNVNGVCGPEFDLLEREVRLVESDQWSQLPENTRQRLGVWCRFQPRERFIQYLSDADFGMRDAGLAGIIITDHRLVYHKFHHAGQVDLAEPGTLCIKKEGDFVMLGYESWQLPGHRMKLVKLHAADVPALLEALGRQPNLKVTSG